MSSITLRSKYKVNPQPVLVWDDGQLVISAGRSWFTICDSGGNRLVRCRDYGQLSGMAADLHGALIGLDSLKTIQRSFTCGGDEFELAYTPEHGCRLTCGFVGYPVSDQVLESLCDWLVFVTEAGLHQLSGDDLADIEIRGSRESLALTMGGVTVAVDDVRALNLALQLLDAAAVNDRDIPLEEFILVDSPRTTLSAQPVEGAIFGMTISSNGAPVDLTLDRASLAILAMRLISAYQGGNP